MTRIWSKPEIHKISGERDAELKLVVGCNDEDIQIIRSFLKDLHTLFILNPAVEHELSS